MTEPRKYTLEEIEEIKEQSWVNGERSALKNQLGQALKGLMYDKEFTREKLIKEREEIIAALRDICNDFGDNDWDEELYLPDVIEKHLARHLNNQ